MTSLGRLADRINLGWYETDTGISFARRASSTEKTQARSRLVPLFGSRRWERKYGQRNLSILTMPGLDWTFERQLLTQRERAKRRENPSFTSITAVERSAPVWAASMLRMPGAATSLMLNVPCPPHARNACRTRAIGRFFLSSFEGLALESGPKVYVFDAAWIDLCGPVTEARVHALKHLWDRKVRHLLIVTSLAARWPSGFADKVRQYGGITGLLDAELSPSAVVDEYTYRDGVPMHQVVLAK